MKDCLIDVLNARDTVLHVFPIAVEDQDGTPKDVDPEREALRLAALMQLVPETETAALHARARSERTGSICLPPTRRDVIHRGCWVGGQHP